MTPLSVAIADDNTDNAETLGNQVTRWGYDAYVYYDPEDYYQKHWPDVLLLDVDLPLGSEGLQVARNARQSKTKVSTIVVITGNDETLAQTRNVGFDHFLVKPLDLDNLKALLEELHNEK